MAKIWVDPPSGWRYGFPKVWDSDKHPDLRGWLRTAGYPEDDLNHVRCWEADVKSDERAMSVESLEKLFIGDKGETI